MADDEHLAYGDCHPPAGQENERGFVGDAFRKLKRSDGVSSFLNRVHETFHGIGSEIGGRVSGQRPGSTQAGGQYSSFGSSSPQHRFESFAGERDGNDVKWYVDGCSYMWAVSVALSQARETIWILDWWLSPELYLRRPPSANEQYRVDRMLLQAAERGVKVNIIVYKEVTQALTREYLSPTLPDYLYSLLPRGTDPATLFLAKLGLAAIFKSLEHVEAENPLMSPPVPVSSAHTKHVLEALHPNISVFRHPDHLPDAQTLQSSFISSLQNMSITAVTASKLPGDALKAVYGMNDDVILYWAHHEKLCLVDGKTAFMGGLDLCYGRWDTNQHPIADAHPGNLDLIVFPGQDYNNARIMDFQDVPRWENNKLDRIESSRMGWSDISVSLHGPVVQDLRQHFVERWNFIYDEKYDVRKDSRYAKLTSQGRQQYPAATQYGQPPDYGSEARFNKDRAHGEPLPSDSWNSNQGIVSGAARGDRGFGDGTGSGHHHLQHLEERGEALKERFEGHMQQLGKSEETKDSTGTGRMKGPMACQIIRSAAKWSNGNKTTEHSIANAYIDIIRKSQHFIYIENQFFITATGDQQKPIRNRIGAAIVERIVRAARGGEKYKMIVVIPAVPAFAGDLKDDSALGVRAIMEFQYNSINRGGHSIMEEISNAGFNPMEYIRFYNLRNYDRINVSASMQATERDSQVSYEAARREHDAVVDPAGYQAQQGSVEFESMNRENYHRYQQSASGRGKWDTISDCYMLDGQDVRKIPWTEGNVPEINAFVSEELYVHSKVLIADDRVVICGSANLNDRSQLGYHDSEIAILIEDTQTIDSRMDGRPWQATKFAATLRRQLFRKHLGLLRPQSMQNPDRNYEPIYQSHNAYDFESAEDRIVVDPLSDEFQNFWNSRARQNTDAFGRVFHSVPHDDVRTWKDYDEFYEHFFKESDEEAEGKKVKKPAKFKWGHVVSSNFTAGERGAQEVKEVLSTIKGTLVEMPLMFLIEEDIAKEGLSLNAFTEEVYT